jgi:hypothetical protein
VTRPKAKKAGPLSLYPLKFEEIVRDVLTIKPQPKAVKSKPGVHRRELAHDAKQRLKEANAEFRPAVDKAIASQSSSKPKRMPRAKS